MESAPQRSADMHRRRFRISFDQSLLIDLNGTRLQEVLTNARTAAADRTVQLLVIEYPTRSLILEGTNRGFNRLLAAYFHGNLNEKIDGVTAVSTILP